MYLLFFLCHRNNKQGVGWCGVTTSDWCLIQSKSVTLLS